MQIDYFWNSHSFIVNMVETIHYKKASVKQNHVIEGAK